LAQEKNLFFNSRSRAAQAIWAAFSLLSLNLLGFLTREGESRSVRLFFTKSITRKGKSFSNASTVEGIILMQKRLRPTPEKEDVFHFFVKLNDPHDVSLLREASHRLGWPGNAGLLRQLSMHFLRTTNPEVRS